MCLDIVVDCGGVGVFCVCVTEDMEQVSDDELDHAAEEDSDKEDQDLDKMFGAWLGELDKLTQVTL